MLFPQYRKYKNIETYFKIISDREFEEISVVGEKYMVHYVKANQYPEIIRIQDMLSNEAGLWEILTEEDYIEREMFIFKNYSNIRQ